MAWDKTVPFDIHGNQLRDTPRTWQGAAQYYDPHTRKHETATYRRAEDFSDRLEYIAGFRFKRTDGTEVHMFPSDFDKALKLMVRGRLIGTFRYVKRGEKFGIALVKHDILAEELDTKFNET